MEYRKCPHCGAQTPAALSRCKTCGHKVTDSVTFDYTKGDYTKSEYIDNNPVPAPVPRTRNGFVGFWLWLSLILNAIMFIALLIFFIVGVGVQTVTPKPIAFVLYVLVMLLLTLPAYIMLLKWRKAGFYILSIITLANIAVWTVVDLDLIGGILFNAIPLLVLYLILQIRSNGVSCWRNLH